MQILWDQFNFDLMKSYKKIINLSNDAFIFSPDVWEGRREGGLSVRKKKDRCRTWHDYFREAKLPSNNCCPVNKMRVVLSNMSNVSNKLFHGYP